MRKLKSLLFKLITIIILFILIDFLHNLIAINVPLYIDYDVEITNILFILKIILAAFVLFKNKLG